MADLNTATRTQVAQTAGVKSHPASFNRVRELIIDTPAVWSAANGDTAGTSLVIPAGSRLRSSVIVSSAAGNASSTISVGLRDATTKVAIDATAIASGVSIAGAATAGFITGTKTSNGQYYVLPVDAEVYLTFGGATPLANQPIRIEMSFVSP
jgi:hypothetical protein